MVNDRIRDSYYKWLVNLVCSPEQKSNYSKLLNYLMGREFYWTVPMDANREEDGKYLRYRYSESQTHYDYDTCNYALNFQCTVLEMMIALAIRCDEEIMFDISKGPRVEKWFWIMIDNLELAEMTDNKFDEMFVQYSIDIMLDRQYDSNGHGGLFYVENARKNFKRLEIWYQMALFLDNYVEFD